MSVRMDFALIDQALFVVVQKFDRVLDGDHVLVTLAIDLVEHGGEGGGFTGTGGTGDEDEAARFVAKGSDDIGQAELIESLYLPGNRAEHSGDRASLMEDVATETSETFQTEGEVELEIFLKAMLLNVCEHAVSERLGVRGRKGWHIERAQLAMHAHARSAVGGEMEVAASQLDHSL